MLNLPNRPLTNIELLKSVKILNIPHFRGIFMRNSMPIDGPWQNETAIMNLDDKSGSGTHWTAYKKVGSNVYYFDSFGDLKPPTNLLKYLGNVNIYYNYDRYQEDNTNICGHLCLKFLME